jgi:hypothetical protein
VRRLLCSSVLAALAILSASIFCFRRMWKKIRRTNLFLSEFMVVDMLLSGDFAELVSLSVI